MVMEIVQLQTKPGQEAEFEAKITQAIKLYDKVPGWDSAQVRRSVENQGRYLLLVEWQSIKAHTEDFRNSDEFTQFIELIKPCLDGPSQVEHGELIASA